MVYIFIFAILLFAIQKPKESDGPEDPNHSFDDLESRKKDRVTLVETGADAAEVRINLIGNAQDTIDISYYILIEGKSTDVLVGSVLDAADRGVKIRILLDGIFNNMKGHLKEAVYALELHPNVELKFYEPLNLLSPWTWNNRLHDKMIISDKDLALIGGRNIGDKYFFQEDMKENFVKDRDVIVFREDPLNNTSSVIDDMQDYYNRLWDYEHSKPPVSKLSPRKEAKAQRYKEEIRGQYQKFKDIYLSEPKKIDWYARTSPTESIKFVYNPLGRINQDPWCLRELLSLASQAEDSIFMQSPYIIPTKDIKDKINQYDIQLDQATVLTNSLYSSPNPFAISGYYNSRKEIVDQGVKVYEYQGADSIHGKTYIFDDDISVIGSFNFDARSSYINSESMVVISSKEFTRLLKETVVMDIDKSLVVDTDYTYIDNNLIEEGRVSWFKKIFIKVLSKFTWFLDHLL